mmetsp:Transcript_833/g.1654  ORF Transcript_833/g.1654 Transcript_833/m.1654 type:complete len:183 (+) Transcript_833:50-598(+)
MVSCPSPVRLSDSDGEDDGRAWAALTPDALEPCEDQQLGEPEWMETKWPQPVEPAQTTVTALSDAEGQLAANHRTSITNLIDFGACELEQTPEHSGPSFAAVTKTSDIAPRTIAIAAKRRSELAARLEMAKSHVATLTKQLEGTLENPQQVPAFTLGAAAAPEMLRFRERFMVRYAPECMSR